MSDRSSPPQPATRLLAEFAATLQWQDLPPAVIAHTKLCVLDALGCCLFGSQLPATRILIDTIVALGGARQASIWGTPYRTSVTQAALANCAAGHSFELDDLHTAALIHATTLSVPVALAFAERDGANGRDFLLACIAGFEVGLRVGIAGTHGLFNRGFHPQGTTGVFCAAATAARMLRLDAAKTQHALGIAASMASGLMAAQEGAMTKRFHSGHAGQAGALAALLAQRGYTGMADAIEKPGGGFLDVYSSDPAHGLLTSELGARWETLAIGFKGYPTVSCIHGPLTLLRSIMREHIMQSHDVQSLEISCSTFTYKHTVWPYQASGLTEAQMNMYYGLAAMAVRGEVFVNQFDDAQLKSPDLLDFMQRITVNIDPAIDARGQRYRDAVRLTLRTRDGRTLTGAKEWRPGSPEEPFTAADLTAKFRTLADGRWAPRKTNRIVKLLNHAEELPSLAPLIACFRLRKAPGA